MAVKSILVILCLSVATLSVAEVISVNRAKSEFYLYRQRVEVLRSQLEKECPEFLTADPWIGKRRLGLDHFLHKTSADVEKGMYKHLLQLLADCHLSMSISKPGHVATKSTPPSSKTTAGQTTKPWTSAASSWPKTTTEETQTATKPTPPLRENTTVEAAITNQTYSDLDQCASPFTMNLTESWRNVRTNRRLSNSDVGVLDDDITWFRFSGAAGTQLMNKCPTRYSCGSTGAYWSPDPMPTRVGDTGSFSMYESFSDDGKLSCKANRYRSYNSTVTRCSTRPGDFVYRMHAKMSTGFDTVCGMD